MRLSINLPVSLPSHSPAQVDKQIFKNKMLAAVLALFGAASVHADATLTYELTAVDGSKNTKKFSTARFYVRIDDPVDKESYLLFEAGKFFPLYAVNPVNSTYSRLTAEVTPYMSSHARVHHEADKKAPGETAQTPETATKKPAPILKPTKKQRRIAGIECRIVHELHQDKAVIEHCMANSARLGVTDREVITMARTFKMARNRDLGWLGTGSGDEAFVSIYSKDLRDNRVLQITAVSKKPLEAGYLRIPREYKQVTAEAKSQ